MSDARRPSPALGLAVAAAALVVVVLALYVALVREPREPREPPPPGPGPAPLASGEPRPPRVPAAPQPGAGVPGPAPGGVAPPPTPAPPPGAPAGGPGLPAPPPAGPPPPPAGPPPPAAPSVRGRVRDEEGRPVAGAAVHAARAPGDEDDRVPASRSGSTGTFELPPGARPRFLVVRAAGFAPSTVRVAGPGEQEVVLLRARDLSGTVVAAEDERPLEGAVVLGESATWRAAARTGPDGRFRFAEGAPAAEEAALLVSLPGRVSAVAPAQDGVRVALARGRAVRGRVVDPAGRPVVGAEVAVLSASALTTPQRARTSAGGDFEVAGLAPGEPFAVIAWTATLSSPADAEWHDEDPVEVSLRPLGAVVVAGPRPRGAELEPQALPPVGPAAREVVVQGSLRFEGVPEGTYALAHEGALVGEPFSVGAGAVVTVAWPGPPPPPLPVAGSRRVHVAVDDGRGAPVEGATVVASGGDFEARATTGAAGAATFEDVPPLPVTLTASAAGRLPPPALLVGEDEGPHVWARLTLAPPVTLEGRVAPPFAATVLVADPDGAEVRRVTAAADGTFRIEGLAPGEVVVEVAGGERLPRRLRLVLPLPGPLVVALAEAPGHDHDEHGH